ncbi:MAG: hypothetical protein M3O70_08720 [Actinomycetota bacterium]|nr:hypothetical protein [Actinomycetota bacterium]
MGYDMFLVEKTGDTEKDYFHLNIWGMRQTREAMYNDHPGMLDDTPEPEFTWGDAEAELSNLRRRGDDTGIAWWKLCSNDGWIVTADECRDAILAYWEGGPSEDDPEWFREWVLWLERAIDHGGFEVW